MELSKQPLLYSTEKKDNERMLDEANEIIIRNSLYNLAKKNNKSLLQQARDHDYEMFDNGREHKDWPSELGYPIGHSEWADEIRHEILAKLYIGKKYNRKKYRCCIIS